MTTTASDALSQLNVYDEDEADISQRSHDSASFLSTHNSHVQSPTSVALDGSPLRADAFFAGNEDVETQFADEANYRRNATYLNSALQQRGVLQPGADLIDFALNNDSDKAAVVNCLYSLLANRHKMDVRSKELQDDLHRKTSDNARLEKQRNDLVERCKSLDHSLMTLEAKLSQDQQKFKAALKKQKDELERTHKAFNMLRSKDATYRADLRRKEQLYEKLKDKLQKAMRGSSGSGGGKAGMDMINRKELQPGRKKWQKPDNAQVALLKNQVMSQESAVADLCQENTALRESYRQLREELQDVLHYQSQSQQQAQQQGTHPDSMMTPNTKRALADYNPAQMQMPFVLVRERIEDDLRIQMALIKKKIAQVDSQQSGASAGADSHTLEALKKKISDQRAIIQEQENVIQASLFSATSGSNTDNVEARRLSMLEQLETQKHEADVRKQRVEDAQARLDNYAQNLDQERRLFAQERRVFDLERRKWAAKNQYAITPNSPLWPRGSATDIDVSSPLQIPIFSDDDNTPAKQPTTQIIQTHTTTEPATHTNDPQETTAVPDDSTTVQEHDESS